MTRRRLVLALLLGCLIPAPTLASKIAPAAEGDNCIDPRTLSLCNQARGRVG